jgi:hypothetical protein
MMSENIGWIASIIFENHNQIQIKIALVRGHLRKIGTFTYSGEVGRAVVRLPRSSVGYDHDFHNAARES